jgi:hypothetical protein
MTTKITPMLEHIIIMALFTLFVGGTQWLVQIKNQKDIKELEEQPTPVKKAV